MISKSKVDKIGRILAFSEGKSDSELEEAYSILNEYRMRYLEPLTKLTLKLREWLAKFSHDYYIAQRLKRTPRIIEKLKRLSTIRLSQLQDIGGCRIIVENNIIVDELLDFILQKLSKSKSISLVGRPTDYREKGRDDSGYRAVHVIVSVDGEKIEIQLRSNMQHYWAESIERTSIIYKKNLKSLEGNPIVIKYFKVLSDIFYEIECKQEPTIPQINLLDKLRDEAESIIKSSDSYEVLHSNIRENFIQAMKSAAEKRYRKLYNWLLIFNWKKGEFQNWMILENKKPKEIAAEYAKNEKIYSIEEGYEVVLIGASSVETIRHTHSHYFGLQNYDEVLDGFDETAISFKKRKPINPSSRIILGKMVSNGKWGKRIITVETIKNHYCPQVNNLEKVLADLLNAGLVKKSAHGYSLNSSKRDEIYSLI